MRAIGAIAIGAGIVVAGCAAPAQTPTSTYDCRWIALAVPADCAPSNDAIAELLHAADAYQMASHVGPTEATWAQMLAAVRRARATLDPDRLAFRERVVAQNAALRIARTVANYGELLTTPCSCPKRADSSRGWPMIPGGSATPTRTTSLPAGSAHARHGSRNGRRATSIYSMSRSIFTPAPFA
jgi:hypothetical protein